MIKSLLAIAVCCIGMLALGVPPVWLLAIPVAAIILMA